MSKQAAELRDLSDVELLQKLVDSREELFNLRFRNATGELDNNARLSEVRKEIARAETVLREREIAAAEAAEE
ncbi:MAG: 50S ribosomal protein L29 [Acidimicrobiia bacterium]